jgi:predicted nucleic acid-binding protein
VACAIEGRCGVLYSEDFQQGQRVGGLRIENPFL